MFWFNTDQNMAVGYRMFGFTAWAKRPQQQEWQHSSAPQTNCRPLLMAVQTGPFDG
jgi:hypothetical protein